MRIAYLVQWDISKESGVLKKISRMMDSWSSDGHSVSLFAASPNATVWEGLEGKEVHCCKLPGKKDLFLGSWQLFQEVAAWKPDLIYLRMNKYFPGMKGLLDRFPTVLEINSYDLKEYQVTSSRVMYLYHLLTRSFILNRVKGYVFLTGENAEHFKQYGKPFEIIGDSITLADFPQPQVVNNREVKIVFIATHFSSWHGVDKIFELAKHFPTWRFDLIGDWEYSDPASSASSNIHFHGHLDCKEYEAIISSADCALATLALHRIGMNETTPLKMREYLAYGIPVIIGYQDTDFPEGAPFILRLPNTEDNIVANYGKIEKFVTQWRGKRVSREEILHLDGQSKEKKRLNFFRKILGSL